MTLAGVVNAIMSSAEYQIRATVDRLYQTYLGRSADSAGLNYWAKKLNMSTMTVNSVSAALIGSTEYQGNLYTTTNQLYISYLGRNAEQTGISYWAQQISSGIMTISAVKMAIAGSAECLVHTQKSVRQFYRTYLDREADSIGLNSWTSQVTSGDKTLDVVSVAIKASDECLARKATKHSAF